MTVPVDVWLRGTNHATTVKLEGVAREPRAWTDEDVRFVLQGMLRVMHRVKHDDNIDNVSRAEQPIALRGLSWIVNPFEDGGVVIAIEIGLGAAIAGPLDIEKSALETMISRVLAARTDRVH
jgi:hypothetical protein